MARKRGRGGARRRRSGASGVRTSNKVKGEIVLAGAMYGYAVQHVTGVAETVAKLPKIKAIGLDGTMALASHLLAANTSGAIAKWADRLSTALAGSVAINFGRVKGDFAKLEAMGYDGGDELSGELIEGQDYIAGALDESSYDS